MAQVSNFLVHTHRSTVTAHQEQPPPAPPPPHQGPIRTWSDHNDAVGQDEDLSPFDFDPLSPPTPDVSFSRPLHLNPFYLSDSDPDPISFEEEEDLDQMNSLTDLFASDRDDSFALGDQDVDFRVLDGGHEFGSSYDDNDLELGLGFDPVAQLGEPSVPQDRDSTMTGLRVVGLDSDSDSEGFVRDYDPFGDPGVPLSWDGSGFQEQRGENLELGWEEVEEQMVCGRDGLNTVINRIEEFSVSSDVSNIEGGEEAVEGNMDEVEHNLEWEFLLAVNMERNLEFESDSFGDYDELFGQLMQNEYALKGSPPTAKSVVENLPIVVLNEDELRGNDVVCAVCKDDFGTEDKVTQLPCSHHYHGDCIVPWLSIRNTCPVCRYELPTDDLDYERSKTQGRGIGLPTESQVRYYFDP